MGEINRFVERICLILLVVRAIKWPMGSTGAQYSCIFEEEDGGALRGGRSGDEIGRRLSVVGAFSQPQVGLIIYIRD